MAKQNKSVLEQIKDKKYIIDIKKVKECYKANNPDKKPLTNIQLAEITGKTPQYFSDLQSPKKSKPSTWIEESNARIRKRMFNEVFILSNTFMKHLDNYCLEKDCVNEYYYSAKKEITRLQDESFSNDSTLQAFYKWFKCKNTIDLKKIIKSDDLFDFNVMCLLDTVISKL